MHRVEAYHHEDNGNKKYAKSSEDTAKYHDRKAKNHEDAVKTGHYRDAEAIRLKLGVQGSRDNPIRQHNLKSWAERKTR
ncbi:MAG: hypothetical protein WC683_18720 [bacterium]